MALLFTGLIAGRLALPGAGWASAQATPATAGTAREAGPRAAAQVAAAKAIAWLHTQQLPDGGFGLRMADGTYRSNASATADAIYALALAGEQPAGPAWTAGSRTALDALATLAPGYVGNDAGQAGKVARAVALAGSDPHAFAGMDLVGIIRAAYDPATGRYHPELSFRHTLAVEGLARAGEPVPAAALDAIFSSRRLDGSWFWAFAGEESDIDSTGRTIQVLAAQAGTRCGPWLAGSAAYLASAQAPEGGWSVGYLPGPPNANSTALALGGLLAAGYDPEAPLYMKRGRGALATLLAFQEPAGSFVYTRSPGHEESRLMATLDALGALALAAAGPPVQCAPVDGAVVYQPAPLR